MRSSKKINEKLKAILAALGFLIAVIVISAIIFIPYRNVWSKDNHYDTLILGASRAYKGIEPLILDEMLGTNSYMIASDSQSPEDRYLLLESALEQESLKTLVLEVSYDTAVDYGDVENGYVYDVEPMSKMEGITRKIKFSLSRFNFWEDEYDNVYPALVSYGFGRWIQNLKGEAEEKGYVKFGTIPQEYTEEEAIAAHDSWCIGQDYDEERIGWIKKTIELAQENGIEVIMINTPDSEAEVWRAVGWEVFEELFSSLKEEYGIKAYDFNLYKERQEVLNDSVDFNDLNHLSEDGADVFTPLLADILKRSEAGEDLSDLFYDTYEEAKNNGSYAYVLEK